MRRQTGGRRPLPEDDGWSRAAAIAGVAVVILILLFLVGYFGTLDRHGHPANQASAVGYLRTINNAEAIYASLYNAGYSSSLDMLGYPPDVAQPSASHAGLIDNVLASGVKSQYRFTYVPGPADKTGQIKTYTVVARPMQYGELERMSFFTDESGVIRKTDADRPATAKDLPINW